MNAIEINKLPIFEVRCRFRTYTYQRKVRLGDPLTCNHRIAAIDRNDAIEICKAQYPYRFYREWRLLRCKQFQTETPQGHITTLVHGSSVYFSLPSEYPLELITHDDKVIARGMLRLAVRLGIIKKPQVCSECDDYVPVNKEPRGNRIEGHHEDYRRPFDVVWLCRRCYGKIPKTIEVRAIRTDIVAVAAD